MSQSSSIGVLDLEPSLETFHLDVINGMSGSPKTIPCKYLYDERGSQLFDQICELDEYYPTRTELSIMRRYAPEMAQLIGTDALLIEFGSGSSLKTRLLLDRIVELSAYVPVDISLEHLKVSTASLVSQFPNIDILPVCADFTTDFDIPSTPRKPKRKIVYFPGSTIGNLDSSLAKQLLKRIAKICEPDGGLLVGIDLKKDIEKLIAAYDDEKGVTAEFNLNLLRRINRELDADFDLGLFEHQAIYNSDYDRIEMHLVSLCEQTVSVGSEAIEFHRDESICTEHSHKYSVDGFARVAASAGLKLKKSWTNDKTEFAVLFLEFDD